MRPVLLSATYLAECFSADYAEAALRFARLADSFPGARYQSLAYEQTGPGGEALATGVLWLGSPDASRVLVLQSATHGVEGFAGSAIQLDSLQQLASAPLAEDIAILYIHALNPYGFAWLRRVNEDGIDLNRNFVDFRQPLPSSEAYARLADLLLPADAGQWDSATEQLWQYRDEHGQERFEVAVTAGQYAYADGLFYGGNAISASRVYLEQLLDEYDLRGREQVAVIDIHTGLGPFGYGEVICDHPPGSKGVRWAREWYGDSVTEPALHTSSSVPKDGLVDYLWHSQLPDRVCFVTLEFGTYTVAGMIDVLRRDHMLHRSAVDWNSNETRQVKRAMRDYFYPDSPDWQEMILQRGRQLIGQALAGLQAGAA